MQFDLSQRCGDVVGRHCEHRACLSCIIDREIETVDLAFCYYQCGRGINVIPLGYLTKQNDCTLSCIYLLVTTVNDVVYVTGTSYDIDQLWFDMEPRTSVVVTLTACGDASVLLSGAIHDTDSEDSYLITLDGTNGTSSIR